MTQDTTGAGGSPRLQNRPDTTNTSVSPTTVRPPAPARGGQSNTSQGMTVDSMSERQSPTSPRTANFHSPQSCATSATTIPAGQTFQAQRVRGYYKGLKFYSRTLTPAPTPRAALAPWERLHAQITTRCYPTAQRYSTETNGTVQLHH